MFFRRLWLTYLIITTISLLSTAIITGIMISDRTNDDVRNAAFQLVEQTALSLSDLFGNIKNASNSLAMNETIQNNLTAKSRSNREINDRTAVINNELLYQGIFNNQYTSIEIFALNQAHYPLLYLPNHVMSAAVVKNKKWYQATVARRGKYYWHLTNEFGTPQICLSRLIGDLKKYNLPIAVLNVNTDLAKLDLLLSNLQLCKTGKVYLLDDQSNQILPRGRASRHFKQLTFENERGSGFVNIDGKKMMVIYRTLSYTNWKLVGIAPVAELSEKAYIFKMTIYSIAFLSLILAILATFFFSYSISRPITQLADTMANFNENNLNLSVKTQFQGEVGFLYRSFNAMVKMINDLIQKVSLTETAKKDAELRALQAQINPHFLYNTLNSIHWMALKYNAHDISKMVRALSLLLRYSLNEMGKPVSLREELLQLDSYVTIQKMRYPDQFELRVNIEAVILDCKVAKLILQPLVENAIIHGIIETVDEYGLIEVKGYLEGEIVILEVINNGTLVDLTKVNALLTTSVAQDDAVHAIQNVNHRIKLNYGNNFGLQYRIVGHKTVAQIRIPAII